MSCFTEKKGMTCYFSNTSIISVKGARQTLKG